MSRLRAVCPKPSLLVALAALVGPLACQEDPVVGALGEPCNISEQCAGDMFCDTDGLDRQCTLPCSSDTECTGVFDASECLAGPSGGDAGGPTGRCVALCSTDADCRGVSCNGDGWCGRGGGMAAGGSAGTDAASSVGGGAGADATGGVADASGG